MNRSAFVARISRAKVRVTSQPITMLRAPRWESYHARSRPSREPVDVKGSITLLIVIRNGYVDQFGQDRADLGCEPGKLRLCGRVEDVEINRPATMDEPVAQPCRQ